MFVQDFQMIERPFDDVAERLRADPNRLLTEAVGVAQDDGEHLRARVGPASWPAPLARTVEVRPGPLRTYGDGVILAFEWDSPRAASLFPHLDADLDFAPFGPERTQATLRVRYQPPGGVIGRRADQLLLHRIAEATIRSFLVQICAALEGHGEEVGRRGAT